MLHNITVMMIKKKIPKLLSMWTSVLQPMLDFLSLNKTYALVTISLSVKHHILLTSSHSAPAQNFTLLTEIKYPFIRARSGVSLISWFPLFVTDCITHENSSHLSFSDLLIRNTPKQEIPAFQKIALFSGLCLTSALGYFPNAQVHPIILPTFCHYINSFNL